MTKKAARTIVFQATNVPTKESGKPPSIDTGDLSKYYAYFENEHHEQFIIIYDYETRVGNIYLSKNGWENPLPVKAGKPQKANLGDSEKAWLKACWKVVVAEEQRRERVKRMQELNAIKDKSVIRTLPPHEKIITGMEHLYDALKETDLAPNCSKREFAYGWTGFIELMAELEEKYKDKLKTQSDNIP